MHALKPLPEDPVDFGEPPVSEVVLGIQFDDDPIDVSQVASKFWPAVSERLPRIEVHQPLPPNEEDFDEPVPTIQFRVLQGSNTQRMWFMSSDGDELVQVQPDRFILNWRRLPLNREYPRYRALREDFYELYAKFVESMEIAEEKLDPKWCEVTYINPIPMEPELGTDDLGNILKRLAPVEFTKVSPAQDSSLNERFLLRRKDGQPYGRLHLNASRAVRTADDADVYNLVFTYRALVAGKSLDDIIESFDEGRDTIVNTFSEVTTPQMHEEWRAKG